MINYDPFLSRSAEKMKESAIRKMGGVAAQGRDIISFAPGYPAPELFAWHEFEDITRTLLSGSDGAVLQYGPTRGYRPLLETIAGLMAARGAVTSIDRLLVTTGSQQGLDLVARVLADPGDAILVELPTYTGAITAFRNTQAHMIGVRQDADGISLDDLDEVWKRQQQAGRRVRFLYVVPNFQNPTGLLIGLAKRRALLEWADRRNVLIVEDDPYRDLYFSDAASESDVRPMRSDDASGRVIYLSSFSKTLAPGYRVAWIDAPAALAAKFELAKQAADLCTGGLDQRVIHQACRRGVLDRQLPVLRAHYQHKRDVMVEALRTSLGDILHWPAPRGGFFLWATLPGGLDADAMIARAVANGVIYVAGEAFFVDDSGGDRVRLSFSAPTPERITEGVARFATTVREELEAARERPRPSVTA
jgi:2-aminoadipate transaminase